MLATLCNPPTWPATKRREKRRKRFLTSKLVLLIECIVQALEEEHGNVQKQGKANQATFIQREKQAMNRLV